MYSQSRCNNNNNNDDNNDNNPLKNVIHVGSDNGDVFFT